jgi:hypothetical protein
MLTAIMLMLRGDRASGILQRYDLSVTYLASGTRQWSSSHRP